MTFLPTLRPTSIPFAWRTLLLASAFFLVLVFNADHVRGQTPPDDPPPDLHADNPFFATFVPFGSSVEGRIDPSYDLDFFVFDLSDQPGPTDVWIYTTGDLDSFGRLYDGDLDLVAVGDDMFLFPTGRRTGFNLRVTLQPGVYVVLVQSFRGLFTGDYTLHVEAVPAPADSVENATPLAFDSPAAGSIEQRGQSHYFRLEFTEPSSMVIHAENPVMQLGLDLLPFAGLDPTIFNAEGEEVAVNIYPLAIRTSSGRFPFGFIIEDDFDAGTYFIVLTTPTDRFETEYPVLYTIQAFEDTYYKAFIEDCEARTQALDDPSIDDPLYACQWHLDQPSGEDINVKPVWDQGIKGEGINVVVVDSGMDWTHEDLFDNVDSSLNHDYTGEGDIHRPFAHHGTNVTGLIAARDNDIGVRGVAPRATIYGYNLLAALATADSVRLEDSTIANAMSRSADVTAISNNSWGAVDGPEASPASALWELAIENGVTRGYGGKGVFYVWAAGNGHLRGDDSNLDGLTNFYAVTAACAVSGQGVRSSYSEMGANLWVCAPGGDSTPEDDLLVVTVENSDRYMDFFDGTSAADTNRLRRSRPRTRGQPGPHLARPQAHPRRVRPQERSHQLRLGGRRAHLRLRLRPLPLQPRVRLRCR